MPPTGMNGIGLVYMGTSVFLNLGDFGSGKVMGLAPYGGQPGKTIDEPFVEVVDGVALARSEKNFVRHQDLYRKRYFPAIRPGQGGAPRRSLHRDSLDRPGCDGENADQHQ